MNERALKEYTIKNIPNTIYDSKIFKSFEYTDDLDSKYSKENNEFKKIYEDVEKEISKQSNKAIELYNKYSNHPSFKGKSYEFFKLSFIYDFLFFIDPEVQKNFNEEQKIIIKILGYLNINKRLIVTCFSIKEINLCFSNQLICSYYNEIDKIRKNKEDKKKLIMYSGHDLYLHCLINFLEIKDKN